jgi:peptidyl-prolyl cis-trans isomerase C
VRSKVFVGAALAVMVLTGCRKAPAAQAGTAAAAGQPATTAQAATPGQPGAAAQPPAPPKPVPAQLPDVIARVNGEEIKKADLDRMIHNMEGRAGQAVPPDRRDEIYRNAIDQLIIYKLLTQESKNRGVKVDDKEIDAKIAELRQRFPTQEAFDQAVKQRGMTTESMRTDARVDLGVAKMMDAEVATLPGPSDADAKAFYDKNPTQFKQPEQVRASHILVRVDANADAAAKKKARGEIDTVLKQVKAGGDFAKLAQQHSQDGSAAQGGDLGYFNKGQMVPEFDKVAFELKPNQISDIVTTQFGYHIIKVIDHKPERTVPFEEAQGQIKSYLSVQKKQERQQTFIDDLKKKAKIEVLV